MTEEIKQQDTAPDDYDYKKNTSRSLRQIASDVAKNKKKETPVEKTQDSPPQDTQPEPKKEPKEEPKIEPVIEPKVDAGEIASKAASEAAAKVATETKEAFKSEVERILNKDKDLQEKQKEADELIAAWDKEKRLPKDYQELITETMRISEVKMNQALKLREQERTSQEEAEKAQTRASQEAKKSEADTKLEDFQKAIASDLDEIYAAKFLPRPANIEEVNNPDTKDEAARETQKVLEFGVKLNTERVKQNLPPVTSLNKIYFLHYRPFVEANPAPKTTQPAGADAPISGARSQTANTQESKDYVYARDHNKTWAQIRAEAYAKIKAIGRG